MSENKEMKPEVNEALANQVKVYSDAIGSGKASVSLEE
jgi:hypothetical protein